MQTQSSPPSPKQAKLIAEYPYKQLEKEQLMRDRELNIRLHEEQLRLLGEAQQRNK